MNWRTNKDLLQNFGVNSLNELTGSSRNANMTAVGTTTSPATNVTVNSLVAQLYSDSTFARTNVGLVNGYNTFTAVARDSYGRSSADTSICYLPSTNSFVYDLNGNLRTNGTRIFEYDDENELIRITEPNQWKSEFSYDGKLRRRVRKEFTWAGSWTQTNEVRYIYDGNLVIQERWLDPQLSTNDPQQLITYTRGRDLSGSFEGAGGIGGLLARSEYHRFPPESGLWSQDSGLGTAFFHADGNGNITCLVNSNQAIVAKYLYDPYGNVLSISGPLAEANLYRFSSKELHENSAMVYYLYRLYDPGLQRWLNRDPLNDTASLSLATATHQVLPAAKHRVNEFAAMRNYPTGLVDPDGRIPVAVIIIPPIIAGIAIFLEGCSSKPKGPGCCYVCWSVTSAQKTPDGGCLYGGQSFDRMQPPNPGTTSTKGCCPSKIDPRDHTGVYDPNPCADELPTSVCIWMKKAGDSPGGLDNVPYK